MEIKFTTFVAASSSTPSTRCLFDGVAMTASCDKSHRRATRPDTLVYFHTGLFTINEEDFPQKACQLAAPNSRRRGAYQPRRAALKVRRGRRRRRQGSAPVWKSTSESGAPDNPSLSHFSPTSAVLITETSGGEDPLIAIEQASRRWREGYDSAVCEKRRGLISHGSALGAINLRACQGIAATCRHEAIIACKVNEVKVQVAAAPGDEAWIPAGLGSLTAGVAGAEAAAAVDVLEAGLAALRASYPARDDAGEQSPGSRRPSAHYQMRPHPLPRLLLLSNEGNRPIHPITDRKRRGRAESASTNTTGICTPAQGRWRSKRAQASPLDLSAPGTQYWSRAVHFPLSAITTPRAPPVAPAAPSWPGGTVPVSLKPPVPVKAPRFYV